MIKVTLMLNQTENVNNIHLSNDKYDRPEEYIMHKQNPCDKQLFLQLRRSTLRNLENCKFL